MPADESSGGDIEYTRQLRSDSTRSRRDEAASRRSRSCPLRPGLNAQGHSAGGNLGAALHGQAAGAALADDQCVRV